MLSKLPGVNSYRKSVRIFSRIYYSFLFLIFAVLMFRNRESLCMQDKLVSMLEMFLFFLAFAVPVPVIYFMDKKGLDFKHKEVINITNGKRLGMVLDVTANLKTGTIESIIVPGSTKFTLFKQYEDIVIPWNNIEVIGEDLILVKI